MEFAEFIKTPQVDGVALCVPNQNSVEGTLCITGHHLILSSRQDREEELWLLHKCVDSVEKRLDGSVGTLTLKCKDFQIVKLQIPSIEECLNIAASIESLSNIDDITLTYPFFHRPSFPILEDGWHAFAPEAEFNHIQSHVGSEWRLSQVNKNYEVCPSYPQTVVVLKCIDDATILKAAAFRQNCRFPVLSYYHKDNGMVLLRCSQPLTGPNGKRCREDELMVNSVLGSGRRLRGYILDTRPLNVTKLATSKGGGVEPEAYYPQWRRVNQSIERPSVLQESLIKLIEACFDVNTSSDKWLSKLDSSGWLGHIKDALTCACVAAQFIDKDFGSVIVHGSEGTSTTLLVTSLTQIILDPDCRTVRGFEALLEREWIQAGHPFADHCVKSCFAVSKQRQESPVFLLFLDCVWQIWQQFSCSFEFNEDFLIVLFKHAYASQFGTFLCNNERERARLRVKEKTISLWSYINCPSILCEYLNPLYDPNGSVIWPSVAPQSLQLWTALYQRWQRYLPAQYDVWKQIVEVKEKNKELKSRTVKLRKHLVKLEKEAIDSGLIQLNLQPDNEQQ